MAAYNNVTLHGKQRCFPVRELLGAEQVITRMWHERHVSKNYTPLQLEKKTGVLLVDEERNLVESDDPTWVPRSVLSVLDGLQAARWAYILTQMGEEDEVHGFIDQMIQRARSKQDRMTQFVSYWHAAMWRVAMDMRGGMTFGKATQAVCDDLAFYHDLISKESNENKIPKKNPLKSDVPDKFNARPSKGGKAGKGSTISLTPRLGGQTLRVGDRNNGTKEGTRTNIGAEMDSRLHLGKVVPGTNRDSPGLRGIPSTLGYPTYGIVPCKDARLCFVVISAFCFLSFLVWRLQPQLSQR